MIGPEKLAKFIHRLQCLVSSINSRNDLLIHQNVNQFYYMQKTAELKMLLEQFEEAQRKLEMVTGLIDVNYTEVFHQWRKDIRWLNAYLLARERVKPIL